MSTEKLTVNQLLSLMKTIRTRRHELMELRKGVSTSETRFFREQEVTKEKHVHYDVAGVDRKIITLDNFLYKADAAIKQCNAMVKVDLDVDVDSLLEPLAPPESPVDDKKD